MTTADTQLRDLQEQAGPNDRWVRLPPVRKRCPYSGQSRGYLYELIKAGKIKSASLKKPGNLTGVRVIWLPSLLAYIERHAEGGE